MRRVMAVGKEWEAGRKGRWPGGSAPAIVGGHLLRGRLPGEVSEGLIGFGHAVGIFAGGHGFSFLFEGGEEFVGEAVFHGSSAGVAAGFEDPADGEGLLAFFVDLHGDLVVGAADASAADFDEGFDVIHGGFEDFEDGDVLDLFADDVEGVVDDALGDGFLALPHEAVDEFGKEFAVVAWIGFEDVFAGGEFFESHVFVSVVCRAKGCPI